MDPSVGRMCSYDNLPPVKRRRTQMTRRSQVMGDPRTFRILVTEIYPDGFVSSGWVD